MALGYSFRPRNFVWGLALAAFLLWAMALWHWMGPENHRKTYMETARNMLGEILMAYDDAAQQKNLPDWQRWIVMEQGRARAAIMARDLRSEFLLSDALKVDFALAFHHFANDTGDARWNKSAEWYLGAVVDKDSGSYYYYPTEAVLHGRSLTREEKEQLLGVCAKWPADWWTVRLADAFGLNNMVNREVLRTREYRAGRQQILILGLEAAVILTGLILAWPLWRFLRRCQPAPRRSDHRSHLRRLWSPAMAVLCFSFASLVGLGITALANPAASAVASSMTKGSGAYWWSFMMVFLGVTITSALAVPLVMRWFMAPELGNLRQVFDLRWRDFVEARWWFLGIAGGSFTFGLELVLQYIVRWLGLPTHVSDHLSRSFEGFGTLALPFGIVWGVMVAPWMEELVNRGFLFTALKNQFGALWGAALSSAIFAWYHFYGWLGTTEVFLFGMLHCFIYQRTRSLAASMILHGCINLPLVFIRWLEWSA